MDQDLLQQNVTTFNAPFNSKIRFLPYLKKRVTSSFIIKPSQREKGKSKIMGSTLYLILWKKGRRFGNNLGSQPRIGSSSLGI
jgi:hypothetical protein